MTGEPPQGFLPGQCGVITGAQARRTGLSNDSIYGRLRDGRWQRLYPGIYAAFSGPIPHEALLWAAVLLGGPGAALSHETAAELDGLIVPADRWAYDLYGTVRDATAGRPVHVTVPHGRVVRTRTTRDRLPRVVFHRSRLDDLQHPTRSPPRTRIEETVIDLTQRAPDLDRAIGWLAAGCQRRLTTPSRLLSAMDRRPRLRHRRELRGALGDIAAGAHTLLEFRFTRRVERAHGMPAGRRQARRVRGGLVQYDDVDYEEYGVVVELDGGLAHPDQDRARDRTRDNITAEQGGIAVRYGWGDVTERPCATAAQLARILVRRGWTGRPHPCDRPGCVIGAAER